MMKKLERSKNKAIAGVCAGMTEYFNEELDPVFLRVAWVILAIGNPLLIILYFVLALALPEQK